MEMKHPTGNEPAHVVMLLLGETKRQYADLLATNHNRVFAGAEVWTCNAGFRIWPHDLVFIMDDLELEAHRWPQYGEDIAHHHKPVITSQAYPAFPGCLAYPFAGVCDALNLQGLDRYFYNTVPYMIAYALATGVKKITVFGADYYHPNSAGREADLANAEWWLGFARGRGCAIELASDTTLMRARENRSLYGYRFDPRITVDRARAQAVEHEDQERQEESSRKHPNVRKVEAIAERERKREGDDKSREAEKPEGSVAYSTPFPRGEEERTRRNIRLDELQALRKRRYLSTDEKHELSVLLRKHDDKPELIDAQTEELSTHAKVFVDEAEHRRESRIREAMEATTSLNSSTQLPNGVS